MKALPGGDSPDVRVVEMYDGEVHIEFEPIKHVYTHLEKGIIPDGTTKVLGCVPKYLDNWKVKLCDTIWLGAMESGRKDFKEISKEARGEHRRIRDEAGEKGTIIHDYAENYPHVSPPPEDTEIQNSCEAFVEWRESVELIEIEKEKIVFSRTYNYCGTLDLHAIYKGEVALFDYKSSSSFYKEMILQLCSYSVALEEMTGERIDHGYIIRLCKRTGKPTEYHVHLTKELKDYWIQCLLWYRTLKHLDIIAKQIKEES